ncbi:MAG: MgtC/SapB family protein [Candidatus Omnitrophica bacterium]|nr:MgtC/SapB family protein [Candidatus Omnitrophota bacterium]
MQEMAIDQTLIVKIFMAVFCGFVLGLERQIRGKPVGIRTSILICMGTMLFIFLGAHVNEGKDATRILGQIVTGVGFLGAGVIMNREGLISGVTSAAIVWLLAGIGASIGFGFYSTASLITFLALLILVGIQYLEKGFKELRRGVHKHIRGD